LNSMGVPGKNDRGIYDDAIFVLTPTGYYTFNGNTDPSRYRAGYGLGSRKGMACLKAGIHRYKIGTHNPSKSPASRYKALVQAEPVTVIRDGNPPYEHTGWHGINIHRGGDKTTSSLGCQTIPPSQWPAFIRIV